MQVWAQVVIVVCLLAVSVALVPAIVALRRAAERAERVFAILERDVTPLTEEARSLVRDLRALSQETRGEVHRVGVLVERAQGLSDGLGRVVTGVAGLARAGQLVGVAAGLKAGLDVFRHRLRKQQGDNHE